MKLHEALLYFVHRMKCAQNVDIAAVVKPDGTPAGWARCRRGASAHSYKSAAVNLLKGMAEREKIEPTDYYLYTTYMPTDMCLGTGLRCHVTGAYYLGGGEIRCRTPGAILGAPVTVGWGEGPASPAWAASPEAEAWSLEGHLRKAEVADYRHPFVADYEIYVDQGMDARLMLLEYASDFGCLPAAPLEPRDVRRRPPSAPSRKIFMRTAAALVGFQRARGIEGNNIGALLVDDCGTIVAFGVNDNTGDSTAHAETNCLAQVEDVFGGAGIPPFSTLFTTLRSCDMCSAALTTMARGNLTVYFGEEDPNLAQTTLSAGRNNCNEARSQLQLRPQARARWARLARTLPELSQVRRISAKSKKVTEDWAAAKKKFKALSRGNVTGRLTDPSALAYFEQQVDELNELATDEDVETIDHCAEFLVWFLYVMTLPEPE